MGEQTVRLPAVGVRWTAVVAVLGEDTGDGRWLSPTHLWTLRAVPVPLLTIGLNRAVAGEVWTLEARDGLLHASGVLTDRQYADDMFGDNDQPPTLFPAIEAQSDVVAPVLVGTVTAIALTTVPSWPGRVQFRLVGGNDGR